MIEWDPLVLKGRTLYPAASTGPWGRSQVVRAVPPLELYRAPGEPAPEQRRPGETATARVGAYRGQRLFFFVECNLLV